MAINRLQASLAQATNEVTVAAANFNFDFTLVKCEAPKEFQDLGTALTKRRKHDAEVGQPHITARRLGALFEGTCPATPALIRAYGLRSSEIAAYAREHLAEKYETIFAEQSGVDGTSIWAAATSSFTALQVQLLACMLARIWPAEQATSVWHELVRERRKEIAGKYEDGNTLHFATLSAAAQADIARSQLAEWDASARAWLRTADKVKSQNQHQLMLIVANVSIPVNIDMMVYSSVMAAWRSALESMENLVRGVPQATSIGPPLLALSSWHLYPDLLAIREKEVSVEFQDQLISPGGRLTIGLATDTGEGHGVYWSLSLAHLNFYGSPVLSEGQYNATSGRLSFSQFTIAVLGAVMEAWSLKLDLLEEVGGLFIALDSAVARFSRGPHSNQRARRATPKYLQNHSRWWRLLSDAARSVVEARGAEQDEARRLVILGMKRSSRFIDGKGSALFFGLGDSATLVKLMKNNDQRVAFLRRKVQRLHDMQTQATAEPSSLVLAIADKSGFEGVNESATGVCQYVTALPLARDPPHHRWSSSAGDQMPGESWSKITDQEVFVRSGDCVHVFMDAESGAWHEVIPMYGDGNTVTICRNTQQEYAIDPPTLSDITQLLQDSYLDIAKVLGHVDTLNLFDPVKTTMQAVSAASAVYKSIPNATLNIKVLDQCLIEAEWVQSHSPNLAKGHALVRGAVKILDQVVDRSRALSCIAYMEACIDVLPSSMESVFALAHEDSLYVAMQLVCDPSENSAPLEMRRVLGNVGKPGITLLVPPTSQMMRPIDPSAWRLGGNPFDYSAEDHFGSTSLHLSFTEYYVPMRIEGEQGQSSTVFFLESYVSVYDAGKWVGDVDVLHALSSHIVLSLRQKSCPHSPQDRRDPPVRSLLSVETWHEILDPPTETFVVRAHGNWIARLAVTSMLQQTVPQADGKGRDGSRGIVAVCPTDFCWVCETSYTTRPQPTGLMATQDEDEPLYRRAYVY